MSDAPEAQDARQTRLHGLGRPELVVGAEVSVPVEVRVPAEVDRQEPRVRGRPVAGALTAGADGGRFPVATEDSASNDQERTRCCWVRPPVAAVNPTQASVPETEGRGKVDRDLESRDRVVHEDAQQSRRRLDPDGVLSAVVEIDEERRGAEGEHVVDAVSLGATRLDGDVVLGGVVLVVVVVRVELDRDAARDAIEAEVAAGAADDVHRAVLDHEGHAVGRSVQLEHELRHEGRRHVLASPGPGRASLGSSGPGSAGARGSGAPGRADELEAGGRSEIRIAEVRGSEGRERGGAGRESGGAGGDGVLLDRIRHGSDARGKSGATPY